MLPDVPLPVTWEGLFGGRTNMAWRGISQSGPDLVLKLYKGPAQNPLFPNDPKAEARLLKRLADHPMTPKFCGAFQSDAGHCNVYEHIPGQSWQKDTAAVAELMSELHQITPFEGVRAAPNGSHALKQQIQTILQRCEHPPKMPAPLRAAEVAPSQRRALLHSDIVPGNLIQNQSGLHLIDWQCPAVGDPCEDIAVFLSPAMQSLYRGTALTEAEIAQFLASYGDIETVARYRHLAPFYHARMAAYCQWQIEHGQPAYAEGLSLELAALQDVTPA